MQAFAPAHLELRLCVVREGLVSTSSSTLLPLPVMGEGWGEGDRFSVLAGCFWNDQVLTNHEGMLERVLKELEE